MSQQASVALAGDDLETFKDHMVTLLPSLRAFARGLCRHRESADDLVQEALMRAWSSRDSFTPGSNLRAWMFTILRNHFYTTIRKDGRSVTWDPEAAERILVQEPDQEYPLHVEDVGRALEQLPDKQREMLLLVAGAELSYEEAARAADCNIGTVKSRLNRGRAAIRAVMDGPQGVSRSGGGAGT
ncbi:MAG: sigma-70 family RNA polymerase sigma factor [Porphyrobacter sp.]|nr:sigma-70 family RNA polymerase sigma factor [Porphyrobacter sp.]